MNRGLYATYIAIYTISAFSKKWRKQNPYNETIAGTRFHTGRVTVGTGTYGKLNIYQWGAENEALKIGSWCSIAEGVKFICGGNHMLDTVTIHFRL